MKLAQYLPSVGMRDFPSTEQLLISGGDARIALDAQSGMNRYGCQPRPDPGLLAFASSTASVISAAGFAAAEQLRARLMDEAAGDTLETRCAHELQRIRQALLQDVADLPVELVFAASGTDVHFMVARYVARAGELPLSVVMVEDDETGSGVAAAMLGPLQDGGERPEVLKVALRGADGIPRQLDQVDAEFSALTRQAITRSRRVLLVMVDQSKTGLIAPSPACVVQLHQDFPEQVTVLVDACQFRINQPALRAYLQHGFMVAVTGSKFFTGPSFSAALLLPVRADERPGLRAFPRAAALGATLSDDYGNLGLLLRWAAALVELQRFRALPQAQVICAMQAFAQAITRRLSEEVHFELLPVPPLDRRPLADRQSWDHLQTIFPFLLYRTTAPGERLPLTREETAHIYRELSSGNGLRCQFGQPVACGTRKGVAVSALRLCLSARQLSDALGEHGKGIAVVIAEAMAALDKTVSLIA